MRLLILLSVLFAATASNAFHHFRNKTIDHEDFIKVVKNKLSNKTLEHLRKSLPGVHLEERFVKLRDFAAKHQVANLTKNQKKEFNQQLKKIGQIDSDVQTANDSIFKENSESGIDEFMLEGDILPSDKQLDDLHESQGTNASRVKRNAAPWQPKWTNGIVPYEFSPEIAAQPAKTGMVVKALAYIQARSCIKFQQSSTAANRIKVIKDAGCYSQIGMIGGVQTLSLSDTCGFHHGTIAHEFIHALGFWHTQNRKDRDNYLIVNTNNIDMTPAQINMNFAKVSDAENENYTPYEYGSSMHYPPHWWAKPGTLTFVPKLWEQVWFTYAMGSRIITFYDIKMINDHYKCHDKCAPATSAQCSNGGFPNPNDCNVCVCPTGYGGALCEKRPDGCGWVLNASPTWQDHYVWFGQDNKNMRNEFTECVHWIQAPPGMKIQARVSSFQYAQCYYGCEVNGVEFKINDSKEAGPRVCCPDHAGMVFTSTVNPLPVLSFNRYYFSSYNLQFRYVPNNG